MAITVDVIWSKKKKKSSLMPILAVKRGDNFTELKNTNSSVFKIIVNFISIFAIWEVIAYVMMG